jgi:hypothetical protein
MYTRSALLVAALCLSLTPVANTQEGSQPQAPPSGAPGAGGPQGRPREPYKPKNLQVLPENANLDKIMHAYEAQLGVECEFCHTPRDPVTHRPDRASDANPMKDVARYMIKMTDDLNDKYLPQLPRVKDVDADAKVDCGTCHRGHSKPEAFVIPPRREGRPGGAPMQPGMQMQPGQTMPNSAQPTQH